MLAFEFQMRVAIKLLGCHLAQTHLALSLRVALDCKERGALLRTQLASRL